jgi:C-terminal processing protease CtpA/Prc
MAESVGDESGNKRFEAKLLSSDIAYIEVPGFEGDGNKATEFGTKVQRAIRHLDEEGACGWVVDLRSNHGGNMWPGLAGLGPLAGEGMVGRFSAPAEETDSWWYRGGKAGVGDRSRARIKGDAYPVIGDSEPVAVLTSDRTASSGEALVLAFAGRDNSKRIGETTAGLATANANIRLSDGSWLILAIGMMEDRKGRQYPEGIPPDIEVMESEARERAVEWLSAMELCQKQ